MADTLKGRRKRGLSQAKAKEIERDRGFTRLGDGYDSDKQERYVHWVAGGSKTPKKRRRRHGG